jgi:hypothetical protein
VGVLLECDTPAEENPRNPPSQSVPPVPATKIRISALLWMHFARPDRYELRQNWGFSPDFDAAGLSGGKGE